MGEMYLGEVSWWEVSDYPYELRINFSWLISPMTDELQGFILHAEGLNLGRCEDVKILSYYVNTSTFMIYNELAAVTDLLLPRCKLQVIYCMRKYQIAVDRYS